MADQVLTPKATTEGKQSMLGRDVAAGGLLNTPKMHLFKSTFNPTPDNVLADFQAQEVTFTGYAAVALTPSAVVLSSDGDVVIQFNRAFFAQTGVTVTGTAGGFWIDDGAVTPTVTAGYGTFGAGGIQFTRTGAFAGVTVTWAYGGPKTADVES